VGLAPGNAFNFNRYGYANNNPVVNVDPTGTICVSTGKGHTYTCKVDDNTGRFGEKALALINKAYTAAVNKLMSEPSRTTTVTVNGKHFEANAGKIGRALIGANILTSGKSGIAGGSAKAADDDRASTYAGGIGSNGRSLIISHRPLYS
jgi:hypothetical protein